MWTPALGRKGLENMKNVYEQVPTFENEKYMLRFVKIDDAKDLLEVYSDKNALPFFNSDNCHGDNFYYDDLEQMKKAIDFWLESYKSRWFVRWCIVDKISGEVSGTIELFHRKADDFFNHTGILRLDLKSEYEKSEEIRSIVTILLDSSYSLFETKIVTQKERCWAFRRGILWQRISFSINRNPISR